MEEILGNREAINPRHVLESSSPIEAQSSHKLIKTSAINKFWMRKFALLRPLKRGNLSNPMIYLARLVK